MDAAASGVFLRKTAEADADGRRHLAEPCGDRRLLFVLQADHGLRPPPGLPCALALEGGACKARAPNRAARIRSPILFAVLTFNSETITSVRPSLRASDATLRANSEILLFRRRARHESPKQAPDKAKPLHCLFSRSPAHFRGRNSLARTSWHKASYPIRPASRIWRRRCRHQAPRSG
jgi:hypothetical protein